MKNLVLVDTDLSLGTPGAEIDDGAALLLLLRAPHVALCGVTTTFGNASAAEATDNVRRLLALAGRNDVVVGQGAARPLLEDVDLFAAWRAGYGRTPAFPAPAAPLPSTANLIIDTVRAHPAQVTLLAIGPLTNLALAVRLAPDIVEQVREVIAMGGSFGAASETAEFNVRCDPEAAEIVFSAGWPLRLLGLNITRQALFTRRQFAQLPTADAALALLSEQAAGWIDRVEAQGWEQGGCALHDAVAVAALLAPALFEWVETAVTVQLHPAKRRGLTTFGGGKRPLARVATAVDAPRCRDLIWTQLGS